MEEKSLTTTYLLNSRYPLSDCPTLLDYRILRDVKHKGLKFIAYWLKSMLLLDIKIPNYMFSKWFHFKDYQRLQDYFKYYINILWFCINTDKYYEWYRWYLIKISILRVYSNKSKENATN